MIGIQRAEVELYSRQFRDRRLIDSPVNTMTDVFRGYLRFAHNDGLNTAHPAV